MRNAIPLSALLVVAGMALSSPALAQTDAGAVSFANSGAPAAQTSFQHGLALLHNFEYGAALADFRKAESVDPGFAMAYWGEAMTFNHPIWMEQDRAAAVAALNRLAPTPEARLAKAPTQREKDYLSALEILYGDGTKANRDQHYAEAMEHLYSAYPDDIDAAALYALALLGSAEGVRDERVYMQAAAILIPLFYSHPNHPGLAHYLIHSCDDPIHAPLALPAARAYSRIAPVSAHAQHMTSHIFLALGMWDDVVKANEAAVAAVHRMHAVASKTTSHCGHAAYWLEYGYLETGRIEQARQIVEGCRGEASAAGMLERARNAADPDDASLLSFLQMQLRFVVDTNDWTGEVAGWTVDTGDLPLAQFFQFAERGWVAAGRHDPSGARAALSSMDALLPKLPAVFDRAGLSSSDPMRRVPSVERVQMEALTLDAEGQSDRAVQLAQQAALQEETLPYAFGPPYPFKPSYELLGELLLQQNRLPEAEAAFHEALLHTPNRRQTLADLQRAGTRLANLHP